MTTHPAAKVFPSHGFVRFSNLIAPEGPIPVSRSSLYLMIKEGRFPAPVKLSARTSAWRVEEIQSYITDPENWSAGKANFQPDNGIERIAAAPFTPKCGAITR